MLKIETFFASAVFSGLLDPLLGKGQRGALFDISYMEFIYFAYGSYIQNMNTMNEKGQGKGFGGRWFVYKKNRLDFSFQPARGIMSGQGE